MAMTALALQIKRRIDGSMAGRRRGAILPASRNASVHLQKGPANGRAILRRKSYAKA